MEVNERKEYYENLRNSLIKEDFNTALLKIRKFIHPVVLKTMGTTINFPIKMLNDLPKVEGPVIYAVNHSNKHDAPVASTVIKDHHYVLVGKQDLELIDKIAFQLNGCVYVDRKDKSSKGNSKNELIKVLLNGGNVLMFPEGTWNLTENKMVLPLSWGIVDIAKTANVPVVPIILEYKKDACYVNCGEPLNFENYSKKDAIDMLEAAMTTLKWDIWESFPVEKRKNVSKQEFEQHVQNILDAYPKLNSEYEKSVIRKNGDSYEEVFAPIEQLGKKR